MMNRVGAGALLLFVAAWIPAPTGAQSRPNVDGMWSDPPPTAEGTFCAGFCTDAGLDRLNALLDDPANDARPYGELAAEAEGQQRQRYIRPRLTDAALKTFPLSATTDPGFLRCEPWGLGRQVVARHQLEIRQRGDRVEMRIQATPVLHECTFAGSSGRTAQSS